MKWSVLVFACLPVLAQQSTRVVQFDAMGNPLPGSAVTTSSSGGVTRQLETMQSVNGRSVPLESSQERLLRDDASSRVVERVIRRYDPNGNPGAIEKVLVEEQKRADGGSSTKTTTYRSDLNGNLSLAERSIAETRKSGATTTTEETIDRPSINGSLATAERRSTVSRETAGGSQQSETVVRSRNQNGQMYTSQRTVSESAKTAEGSTQSDVTYEYSPTGARRLLNQTVSRTVKSPGGGESTVVDVYTANTPGIANASDETRPQLREQKIIQKSVSAAGAQETVDVRRPTISDPNRLGPPQRHSQTTCTGKCP